MKDTAYYDQESSKYSKKRYPEFEITYTQFLFKRRLALLLNALQETFLQSSSVDLLEIGCADGYVLSTIKNLPIRIRSLIGIDISPAMIEVASQTATANKRFYVRGTHPMKKKAFHGVVEVGVLNLTDLSTDLLYVKDRLKTDGYFFCSIAASTSLLTKLKPESATDYHHFLTYEEYEREIRKYFFIAKSIPYGLFIPYLWRFPRVARIVQPSVETLLKTIIPNLFHEKLYILKMK